MGLTPPTTTTTTMTTAEHDSPSTNSTNSAKGSLQMPASDLLGDGASMYPFHHYDQHAHRGGNDEDLRIVPGSNSSNSSSDIHTEHSNSDEFEVPSSQLFSIDPAAALSSPPLRSNKRSCRPASEGLNRASPTTSIVAPHSTTTIHQMPVNQQNVSNACEAISKALALLPSSSASLTTPSSVASSSSNTVEYLNDFAPMEPSMAMPNSNSSSTSYYFPPSSAAVAVGRTLRSKSVDHGKRAGILTRQQQQQLQMLDLETLG